MKDDEAKKRILARRAAFVAATFAGVSGVSCDRSPFVCLEPAPVDAGRAVPDAGAATPPMPCLSEAILAPTSDAAGSTIVDGGEADAGARDAAKEAGTAKDAAAPQPCLKPMIPRPRSGDPMPCLYQ